MRALDTNILVRLVTADDPAQCERAARFIESNDVFVPKSVLLELEWVLRYSYALDDTSITNALSALLDTRRVTVEDDGALREAVSFLARGMDFADALHLASSSACSDIATFDKAFIGKGRRLAPGRVTAP